jgi:predicted O-methyltransferase YrrM
MILLQLNQGPGPMLEMLGGMALKAVSVAVKLDIFESLNSGPLTAAEIAHRIEAGERGIQLMLNALEAIGYVKQQGGRYSNTPMTAKWMVRSSPHHIVDMFAHINDMLEIWGNLEEAIRTGETPVLVWEWLDQHPGSWDRYNAAMMGNAQMAAPDVVAKVKLPVTAGRLLDVGGSHGLFAINFCRRYPDLSATILDGPPTRKLAEANIAAAGMEKRVSFREGDFWTDDLGNGYDVALLSNIIHIHLPDKNIELLQKVGAALNPGGVIVIMDQMATPASAPTAKAMAGLMGLNLFVAANGQTYPPRDVAGWLRQAGLTNPREIFLRKSPGFALVVGTKRLAEVEAKSQNLDLATPVTDGT